MTSFRWRSERGQNARLAARLTRLARRHPLGTEFADDDEMASSRKRDMTGRCTRVLAPQALPQRRAARLALLRPAPPIQALAEREDQESRRR